MGSPNVQGNTATQVRGSYTKIGILVQSLYNIGESKDHILAAVRSAIAFAEQDGVGQESPK